MRVVLMFLLFVEVLSKEGMVDGGLTGVGVVEHSRNLFSLNR